MGRGFESLRGHPIHKDPQGNDMNPESFYLTFGVYITTLQLFVLFSPMILP